MQLKTISVQAKNEEIIFFTINHASFWMIITLFYINFNIFNIILLVYKILNKLKYLTNKRKTSKIYTCQINTETYRSGHNGTDSKSVVPFGTVGSNPTVSASRVPRYADSLRGTLIF